MKLKIVILSVACISCLVPPAFCVGLLATKVAALGAVKGATLLGAGAVAAKGVAALAVKGAIIKGAVLLAKGAAIKGAAALATKGVMLAGSKLPLPLPYTLQKPSAPENDVSEKPTVDVSQNLSTTAIGVSPSLVEIDNSQKHSGAKEDVLQKPSDVDVNVVQTPPDLEINVQQKPNDMSVNNLQKPVDVEVYKSRDPSVVDLDEDKDEDDIIFDVSVPVCTTTVCDKVSGILGILKSAIQNKTEAVNNFIRSLQWPVIVKQPIIYENIKKPIY